jgi:hypothetical protein
VAAPSVALSQASDSGYSSGDYITNVTTPQFITNDATPGTSVAVFLNGVAYTGQTLAPGSYSVTAVASDQYGNSSPVATAPHTLLIATSGPVGSWTISGGRVIGGVLFTGSKTPTLTLAYSAPGGIYQMATSTDNGTSWSAPAAFATSTSVSLSGGDGVYNVVVKLIDAAGNIAYYSQPVGLDTTGPVLSYAISSPQGTGIGYDGSADIMISGGASDASGVSSVKVVLDSSVTITSGAVDTDTLLAGSHTIVVTGVDGFGNTSTQTITFQLRPSRAGIATAINEGVSAGAISSSEAARLLTILKNTSYSLTTDLNGFITEVRSQNVKVISSSEASLLINWAQDDLKTLW